MKKNITIFILLGLFLLTITPLIHALTISNSEDWRDIYSVLMYGQFEGDQVEFLVSPRHARILIDSIEFQDANVFLASSARTPFAFGYKGTLEGEGAVVTEIVSDQINFELFKRLVEINRTHSIIVIDDSYGYNAVSVAGYATLTSSYVLFLDSDNIETVSDYLANVPNLEVLIYGHVDREVQAALAQYNPEIINFEDRFLNNEAIANRWLDVQYEQSGQRIAQIVLTNGEFIESSLFSPGYPVLFLGKNNVPDSVTNYIKKNNIAVAVLVGNQYVNSATTLRRQLGISVFVKFARSARVATGPFAQVEGLDIYYLPVYQVGLDIDSIVYNEATNKLEVTVRNTQDLLVYFKGTYTLAFGNNERVVVGDVDPIFLDANDIKTMTYDAELTGDNITANAFVIFGEGANSLENTLERIFSVNKVHIFDNSEIEIEDLSYILKKGNFVVTINNIGNVTTYVDLDLINVKIAGERYTFGSSAVTKIDPGDQGKITIKSDPRMLESDIEDNPTVKIMASYGERPDTLIKRLTAEFELTIKRIDIVFWILVFIIFLLFFLILLSRRRKKKKQEEHYK